MLNQAHLFSIFIPDFFSTDDHVGAAKECLQQDAVHRIVKVLRYDVGDNIIIFDQSYHGLMKITQISKKSLTLSLVDFEKNIAAGNHVAFLLPLLKKEALEEAVYALAEIGATEIHLVTTQKSRQKLLHEKEFERLQAIVVAAAEQSKNYQFPVLYKPKPLFEVVTGSGLPEYDKVLFDGAGDSFFQVRAKITCNKACLLVGPEGGLTGDEVEQLVQQNFLMCGLTSTTLRAVQAVPIAMALFRLKA